MKNSDKSGKQIALEGFVVGTVVALALIFLLAALIGLYALADLVF